MDEINMLIVKSLHASCCMLHVLRASSYKGHQLSLRICE